MRNLIQRILLLSAALLFVFALVAPSLQARTFSDIVAFGDSLTYHDEMGDPEAFTNCPPDGPCVWVEYMAAEWNASVENHALGGAKTAGPVIQSFDIGLVSQIELYAAGAPSFDPDDTLFALWIGGNDLLEFLRGEADTIDSSVLISNAMGNISEGLNDLENAGAENFLILSLPDISKSPAFGDRTAAERAQIQTLAQNFNSALETTVQAFENANPGIVVYRFNVFTYLNGLIADGVFANTTGTYLTLDASGQPTGTVNGPADDYLFWDLIHPTTRAHRLLGNAVADKVETDDDDDSSSCFISTAAGAVSPWMALIGVALGLGVAAIRRASK